MRNEEFDIVRDLIAGRGQQWSAPTYSAHAVAPASFREIDGQELARQYVAHRKFRESELQAQQMSAEDVLPEHVRIGALKSQRQVEESFHLAPSEDARSDGWLSSLARRLWKR